MKLEAGSGEMEAGGLNPEARSGELEMGKLKQKASGRES